MNSEQSNNLQGLWKFFRFTLVNVCFMNTKIRYFLVALVLVLEWFITCLFHAEVRVWPFYLFDYGVILPFLFIGVWLLILILCFSSGRRSKNRSENRNTRNFSNILSRFLSNSVRGEYLSFIILILFIVHLAWLGDVVYDIFFNGYHQWSYLGYLTVVVLGIMSLVIIYPDYPNEKISLEDRKVIVSGLSVSLDNLLLDRNIELILKPFAHYAELIDEGEPVALSKLNRINKYVIIPSTSFKDAKFSKDDFKDSSPELMRILDGFNAEEKVAKKRELFGDFLTTYALEKFNKSGIEFNVIECVDYESFDDLFRVIEKVLEEIERDKEQKSPIIYISSGTSILSGALSMHAAVGKRLIMYGSQSSKKIIRFFYPTIKSLDTWFRYLQDDYNRD